MQKTAKLLNNINPLCYEKITFSAELVQQIRSESKASLHKQPSSQSTSQHALKFIFLLKCFKINFKSDSPLSKLPHKTSRDFPSFSLLEEFYFHGKLFPARSVHFPPLPSINTRGTFTRLFTTTPTHQKSDFSLARQFSSLARASSWKK